MSFITLITGPGSHSHVLVKELIDAQSDFQVAEYWPYPSITIYQRGKLFKIKRFTCYNFFNHLIWWIFNKLSLTGGNKKHLDLLFTLYDIMVSRHLKKSDLLIAWPQVSLNSIKKMKKKGGVVHLEYPMIHINEHMRIMRGEYKKWKTEFKKTTNLFSSFMIRRINDEINLADKIFLLSSYARKTFNEQGIVDEKIVNRKIRIDTNWFHPAISSRSDQFIILFVGRIDMMKGVHYLLQVFNSCDFKDSELWLAGNISPEIDNFIDVNDKNGIRFLGYQEGEQLKKLYQQASIMVLSSIQESFGMVILEAMACGLPVIASKNSGGPDIIEHGVNGYIYDPFDTVTLKKYIERLHANPALVKDMSAAARRTITGDKQTTHS